jgi:hypothetical protein
MISARGIRYHVDFCSKCGASKRSVSKEIRKITI